MSGRETIDTGFVVHRRRLRETSLLLQLFTREHGRITVSVRGALGSARRPGKTSYVEFLEHHFAWTGRGDVPNLVRAEPTGRPLHLGGARLFSGLYVNELIARFVHRGEAEQGYEAYLEVLYALGAEDPLEPALRRFEVRLLESCGYGMELLHAADTGEPIAAEQTYHYVPERGPVTRRPPVPHRVVGGATLTALAGLGDWNAEALREAKQLMRFVVGHHLGGRPLTSRELFRGGEDETN